MRMTKRRRAEEAQAATAELAPTKKVSRSLLEGTIRSVEANAERFEAAGLDVAAARARALADRSRDQLAAWNVRSVTDESRAA